MIDGDHHPYYQEPMRGFSQLPSRQGKVVTLFLLTRGKHEAATAIEKLYASQSI
jgi:hypothetical protein